MWSQVTEEQIRKITYEFISDLVFAIVIIYLLELSINYQKGCGIPIKQWLIGFTALFFSRSTWQVIKIAVLTYYYEYKNIYDIFAFTVSNGLMFCWIIYGYALYYSDKNDCANSSDTSFYDSLMIVILFIAYVMGVAYCMFLCTFPCIYSLIDDAA